MTSDAESDDLDALRTEQGFDAFTKEVARQHGESEAVAAFAHRTPTEREAIIAANRRHLEEWRSTPEGEANYQQTCSRVLRTVAEIDVDGPTRAAG